MKEYKTIEKLELKSLDKTFRKVTCPSCDKEVDADNINLQNSLAKCGGCNSIFSIEKDIEILKTSEEVKQEFIRPEGIDLFYFKNSMDITVQQHVQGLDMLGLVFSPILAIFSFLIFFIKGTISIYPPIGFTLGAIYFIYKSLNYQNNKTYIDISDKYLNIKARPKHFSKDRSFEIDEIDQLYIKHAADGSGYFTLFMIVNGINGQKHEKLLTVNTLSKAKYMEQEIEKRLNIEDRKVPEATA